MGTHHNRKNALLHLTRILRSQNDHLHPFKVDLDRSRGAHPFCEPIGGELTCVVDDEIGIAEMDEFFSGRTDQHVVLPKGVGGRDQDG